ncbi:MAG: thermonuclease family protein [Pseudomonadota bacterium]
MNVAITLAACLLALPASGQDIRVINGDTIEMDGEVIGLWGIDAPELDQTCLRDGEVVAIGQISAEALEDLVSSKVLCIDVGTDPHGRAIAQCRVRADNSSDNFTTDLGLALVSAGLAWDWPEYSEGAYSSAQARAQAIGLGVWAHDCIPPWEWRERN